MTLPYHCAIVLFVLMTACSVNQKSDNTITVPQLITMRSESPSLTVVDVRTPAEISTGKISGAMEIEWQSERFLETIRQLDRDAPVVMYCAAGGRSAKAAELMKKEGFTKVFNLKGGIDAWKAAGYPVK